MPLGRWVIRTAESVVLTPWPPGPGRAVHVDAQVVVVDLHLGGLHLGHHEHAGGRGVHPSLGLGDRHPLHPVDATLELEHAVGGVVRIGGTGCLHRHGDRLVAAQVGLLGVEHLDLPATSLGELGVHPEQVAGEQRRLLAALAGLDLDQGVRGVVGVARGEQPGEPFLHLGELSRDRVRPRRRRPGSSAASSRAAARSAVSCLVRGQVAARSGSAPRSGGRRAARPPGRRGCAGSASCRSSSAILLAQPRRCLEHAHLLRRAAETTNAGCQVSLAPGVGESYLPAFLA